MHRPSGPTARCMMHLKQAGWACEGRRSAVHHPLGRRHSHRPLDVRQDPELARRPSPANQGGSDRTLGSPAEMKMRSGLKLTRAGRILSRQARRQRPTCVPWSAGASVYQHG